MNKQVEVGERCRVESGCNEYIGELLFLSEKLIVMRLDDDDELTFHTGHVTLIPAIDEDAERVERIIDNVWSKLPILKTIKDNNIQMKILRDVANYVVYTEDGSK